MRPNVLCRRFAVLPLYLAVVTLSGCTDRKSESLSKSTATFAGDHPIQVACTTGMVADMIAAVGGEHVQVSRMMGEGVDPHLYEPTMADNTMLAKADIVFYNGLHLEPGMHDVFVVMSKKKPVHAVADYLRETAPDKLIALEGDYFDPHVWFDPELWAGCVPGVIDALSRFDPKNAGDYEKQGNAYRDKILELSAYGRQEIGKLPKPRYLVTAHDAFSYFGLAFEIEVEAIQGVSTEAEASVSRFGELVDVMVDHNVKAVFSESSINSKNVEALLEGCKAKGHEVKLGGELYSDALGPEDSAAGEYLGMVRHNIDTIVTALQ